VLHELFRAARSTLRSRYLSLVMLMLGAGRALMVWRSVAVYLLAVRQLRW
jgi:hypothetical protein